LHRRFWGKTTSREEHIDLKQLALSKAQEAALLSLINKLTYKGLPPTPRIVKNLAEEMRGGSIGKN